MKSVMALCLEFVILTVARQGEGVRSVRDGVVHGMRSRRDQMFGRFPRSG